MPHSTHTASHLLPQAGEIKIPRATSRAEVVRYLLVELPHRLGDACLSDVHLPAVLTHGGNRVGGEVVLPLLDLVTRKHGTPPF